MKKAYNTGTRSFEIDLAKRLSAWTVTHVSESASGGTLIAVPELRAIRASSPDEAFARACDGIDKWLFRKDGR